MNATTRTLACLTIAAALAACSDVSGPTAPLALAPNAPRLQGGSGGGGTGGGGSTTITAPSITQLDVKTGYGPYGGSDGDVQATWKVDMGTSGLAPRVRVRMSGTQYSTLGFAIQTIDYWDSIFTTSSGSMRNAYMPLNTTCTVTVDLLDAAGNVLATKTATGSTPATARLGNTAG